jgi:pimeloyl-ACP methyl ester carboxylesterase
MALPITDLELSIPAASGVFRGILTVPPAAHALVLFAHGTGSSRWSPRHRRLARQLREAGLATLLFDLLTEEEERVDARTGHLRFDVDLLAARLDLAMAIGLRRPEAAELPVGIFGAGTGAAAALVEAARRPDVVRAVVSRGGRPDLAGEELAGVAAPTLLIVGGDDPVVLGLNRQAMGRMVAPVELAVVPGGGHLFQEPGALDRVAELAASWFCHHLAGVPVATAVAGRDRAAPAAPAGRLRPGRPAGGRSPRG